MLAALPPHICHDGRINLEHQRKRAKTLLRHLLAGTAPAHFKPLPHSRAPRLADAQWLIAQELGFASWPRLKAHVDAIDFAARNPGFEADDEARSVHWRCGNDIAHTLRLAGFKGAFHTFIDPLCMGPVPALPAQPLLALRNDYISRVFGMPEADVARRSAEEYAALAQLDGCPHAVLWCEADAYDQLFLIRVLAGIEQLPECLELIEISQVPGVQRFIGIGQLAPDLLAWLWPQRRRLDEAALALARRAWAAYCAPSPLAWAQLAHAPSPALPLLAPALLRQLQELPGLADGLSLTERLALGIVAEAGSLAFGRVFAELMGRREPLPYLGDQMFHALMRPLIDAPTPLLIEADVHLPWPQRSLTLTALGQQVLAGDAYWLDHAAPERWVGGVRLQAGLAHWALDAHGQPVWRHQPS